MKVWSVRMEVEIYNNLEALRIGVSHGAIPKCIYLDFDNVYRNRLGYVINYIYITYAGELQAVYRQPHQLHDRQHELR
jgi:hypothetical protein